MPKGPKGEWRPDDDIACAVHVGRIAIGEIEDTKDENAEKPEKPCSAKKPAPSEAAE